MAVRPIDASRFGEILEQWKKDCLEDNDTQGADIIFDVILQLDDMPTLTPQNEALTLDELRQMDGEPVYVVFRPDNSGDKPQFWALVSADKQHDEVYLLDSMGGAGSYDEIWANLEAIYRRPPEGEA